jgi:hypothetical protein
MAPPIDEGNDAGKLMPLSSSPRANFDSRGAQAYGCTRIIRGQIHEAGSDVVTARWDILEEIAALRIRLSETYKHRSFGIPSGGIRNSHGCDPYSAERSSIFANKDP